jgi:hypothetical protein
VNSPTTRLVLAIGLLAAVACALRPPFVYIVSFRDGHPVGENIEYEWVWSSTDLDGLYETVSLDSRRLGVELLSVAMATAIGVLLQSAAAPFIMQLRRTRRVRHVTDHSNIGTANRPNSTIKTKPPGSEAATAVRIAAPRRNLSTKVLGDQAVVERLVVHERIKAPGVGEEELLIRAIEAWENDNR